MRKIAVFTGTRADYGLLYWLLKDIESDNDLSLQLLVTGSHLSPDFGETWRQIEEDGFSITEKVDILLSSDTASAIAKSAGLGMIGFSDALERMQPDSLVVLGDRYEALAASMTANIMKIPIFHLHGGEITEGAIDDAFRHAITKLSQYHFTASEAYRQRVIQLGEPPDHVFNTGAPGLDHCNRLALLSRHALAESLSFDLSQPYLVVTYHPVTLANEPPANAFNQLLQALDEYPHHRIIITYPNADAGGRTIIPLLEEYASAQPNRVRAIQSLGQLRYLSALKFCDAVVGNSSSGIIEAPAFGKPTVNIGARQKGRLAASSVLHCTADKAAITQSIRSALDGSWQNTKNPYGQGNASGMIIKALKKLPLHCNKTFYDIPSQEGY